MADDSGRKAVNNRLVKCPHALDVHYFIWHCRQQKALGIEPCAKCDAMEIAKGLQETMDHMAD